MALISAVFYSCDKEESDKISPENAEKSIIVGNTLYNTGHGYSILRERPFNFAIDINSFSDTEVSDFPEIIDVDIQVIKTNEDLNEFITSSLSGQVNNDDVYQIRTNIEDRLTLNEDHVSVIARISIDRFKYQLEPNGALVFTDRAKDLINTNQIDRFIRRYGSRYIKTAILGGDIYYIYSYDISVFDNERRAVFEKNIKLNAENTYGVSTATISNEVREEIISSTISYEGISTISGYLPSTVSNTNSIQEELRRVLTYLTENPTLSAVRSMTFESYSKIQNLQEFEDAFLEENKCYDDFEKWKTIRGRVLYVYNNTIDEIVKLEAESALTEINQQIANSLQCANSVTPAENLYSDITL